MFILDTDPNIAATYYCDKHVVKIPLEIAQMLCSAFDIDKNPPYKRTHYNHPVTKWIRSSESNYKWAITHGLAICKEYTVRYGKRHKCEDIIEWCRSNMGSINFASVELTEHPKCMPDECKIGDVVASYKNYYVTKKMGFAKWKTKVPEFVLEII